MMTKESFELIARVLRDNAAPLDLVEAFTLALENEGNDRFDANKFVLAAYGDPEAAKEKMFQPRPSRRAKRREIAQPERHSTRWTYSAPDSVGNS